jgi:hypothetical protein
MPSGVASLIIILVIVVALSIGILFLYKNQPAGEDLPKNNISVTDFESCARVGNAVMESYPRQCRSKDGRSFTENIGNELEKMDLIRIENPRPNQEIQSPLIVKGEARGFWFFEGDFPIKLLDADGNIIIQHYASANPPAGGDWMTEDFVAFETRLEFENSPTQTGTLILERDNPSDLPENDDELEVPIKFEAHPIPGNGEQTENDRTPGAYDGCVITGCSSHVCAQENVITTCEFLPEYACYQNSGVCEHQSSGQCAWTQTQKLKSCLSGIR